jgi:hypothetical protein
LLRGVERQKKVAQHEWEVLDVANKTTQQVDTRARRTRLIAELADAKIEGRASELGCDYLLIAEVTELKASKPGGITKMMKTTTADSSAGKDFTEARMSVQLARRRSSCSRRGWVPTRRGRLRVRRSTPPSAMRCMTP